MRERKEVDPDWTGAVDGLEGGGEGETIISMYYIRERSIFNQRGKVQQNEKEQCYCRVPEFSTRAKHNQLLGQCQV